MTATQLKPFPLIIAIGAKKLFSNFSKLKVKITLPALGKPILWQHFLEAAQRRGYQVPAEAFTAHLGAPRAATPSTTMAGTGAGTTGAQQIAMMKRQIRESPGLAKNAQLRAAIEQVNQQRQAQGMPLIPKTGKKSD